MNAYTEEQVVLAELDGLTLGDTLRRSARLYPLQPFLKFDDKIINFLHFDKVVDRFATGLLKLDIRRGDHVAVWLANSIEWVLVLFACARVGAVLIPINTRYTADEAGYILAQSDARALIFQPIIWDNNYLSMLQEIAPNVRFNGSTAQQLPELPHLRHLVVVSDDVVPGCVSFSELMGTPTDIALAEAESLVMPSDPLLIVYTSGTTGKPKGAMHNHIVIKQATRVGLSMQLRPGGRVLGHMPLYHVAGLYMGLLPALTLGGCFVIMQQWDPARALELLEREKISLFGGIPTHYVDLVDDPTLNSRDLSTLEIGWIGGGPMVRETYDYFKRKLDLRYLLSTYGMTENTISTTFNRLQDPAEVCCENRAPVLGDCEVRIVDPETGQPMAQGEVGEIWCRGETVMIGYYKNPEATRAAVNEDGWLKTGDMGRFDDKGYLSITGRLKEMYKNGGSNVYPAEVEQRLIQHPAVAFVAVIGVPDERMGEVGFAFFEKRDGLDVDTSILRAYCKETLAAYKIPRYFEQVETMPRTTTGKIQKATLAEWAKVTLSNLQMCTR